MRTAHVYLSLSVRGLVVVGTGVLGAPRDDFGNRADVAVTGGYFLIRRKEHDNVMGTCRLVVCKMG